MSAKDISTLSEVRQRIDAIDIEIVALLGARQQMVRQAAKFKKDEDSVRSPDRVAAVIARVRQLANEIGASPEIVEHVYRAMIESFINYELIEQGSAAADSP